MDGILYGFEVALSFENLIFVTLGVLVGTVVGLLPGLGPTAAIALLIPLTYPLTPTTAIIFLAGIYYGSMFGGRIPAVLLNLPGDASSVVTTFDGYPMRLQGKAGVALGITAIGSFAGGIVALIGLAAFAPLLSRWALRIGPPEMFSLTLFGLVMIAMLASDGLLRGLLSAGIGILIASVGLDMFTGGQRFTFGSVELMDGIGIVPLAVGMFGLAEIFRDSERRFFREKVGSVGRIWPSLRDFLDVRWAILRASIVGFLIGVVPGGGGAMSSIVAYGVEKRFSPAPEKFGKGAIDGLAATETADNASSNSSFIPLLTLGIPPNPVLALIAGALILHGVTPGPRLIEQSPDLFWGVIASMFIGTVILLVLNLPFIGVFVQILKIPSPILVTVIVSIAMAGVYSVRNNIFDVYLTIGFAILGYVLKKASIPPGPLILGFILAPMMENHFRTSMLISGGSLDIFVTRPVSLVLLVLVMVLILSLILPSLITRLRGARKAEVISAGETKR